MSANGFEHKRNSRLRRFRHQKRDGLMSGFARTQLVCSLKRMSTRQKQYCGCQRHKYLIGMQSADVVFQTRVDLKVSMNKREWNMFKTKGIAAREAYKLHDVMRLNS